MKINYLDKENNKVVSGKMFHPAKPTYDNYVQMYFESTDEKEKQLYEGLINSYPYDEVRKYIIKYLNINPKNVIDYSDEQGYSEMIVIIPNDIDTIAKTKKVFDFCGYYNSISGEADDPDYIELHFTPKFRENDVVDINSYPGVYHITKTRKVNKILQQGLVPKSSNTAFNYPERIHFYVGTENLLPVKLFATALYARSKDADSDYTILKVLTNKLPENIKFYGDPDFHKGVYTNDNIPPECLQKVARIDAKNLCTY